MFKYLLANRTLSGLFTLLTGTSGKNFNRFCITMSLTLSVALTLPVWAGAQVNHTFIETRIGVFQSSAKNLRVIVSYAKPGIFVTQTPITEVQVFDPEKVTDDNPSLFIAYNVANNTYDELHLGAKKYRINGSLSITHNYLSISIDNSNPYLTITDKKHEIILGFRGLEQIVNERGNSSLAFLEANQFNEFSDIILPYVLNGNELYIKKKKVELETIGLALKQKRHVCVAGGEETIYISSKDINSIKKALNQKTKINIAKEKSKRELFENSLLLKRSDDAVVYLDVQTGKLFRMQPHSNKLIANATICEITYIDI